jgi:hypothetical protein
MFAWLSGQRKRRVMVAKASFIIHVNGRPVGLVPEGSCWVKSHPVVRAHRDRFETREGVDLMPTARLCAAPAAVPAPANIRIVCSSVNRPRCGGTGTRGGSITKRIGPQPPRWLSASESAKSRKICVRCNV